MYVCVYVLLLACLTVLHESGVSGGTHARILQYIRLHVYIYIYVYISIYIYREREICYIIYRHQGILYCIIHHVLFKYIMLNHFQATGNGARKRLTSACKQPFLNLSLRYRAIFVRRVWVRIRMVSKLFIWGFLICLCNAFHSELLLLNGTMQGVSFVSPPSL